MAMPPEVNCLCVGKRRIAAPDTQDGAGMRHNRSQTVANTA